MGVSSKYHVNQSMYVTEHFQNYSNLKSRLDIYKLFLSLTLKLKAFSLEVRRSAALSSFQNCLN